MKTNMKTNMPPDRSRLIRLASTLPVGSGERRTILAELQKTAGGYSDAEGITNGLIDIEKAILALSREKAVKREVGQLANLVREGYDLADKISAKLRPH